MHLAEPDAAQFGRARPQFGTGGGLAARPQLHGMGGGLAGGGGITGGKGVIAPVFRRCSQMARVLSAVKHPHWMTDPPCCTTRWTMSGMSKWCRTAILWTSRFSHVHGARVDAPHVPRVHLCVLGQTTKALLLFPSLIGIPTGSM